MNYEETSNRNESLIPNTQIESMFMRVCNDEQMTKYVSLVDNGHVSLATAYASNIVYKLFYALVDQAEKNNIDIEGLVKKKDLSHV